MSLRLRFFFIAWLVLLLDHGVYAQQQLSLGIPTLANVLPGDVVTLPVIAYSGLDSVTALQFVIKWDSTVLSYLTTTQYGLPQMAPSNFGFSNQANLLRFVYTDPNILSGAGVSVPDSTTLFAIRFRVIGPINSASPVQITEEIPTTYFEVIEANGTVYTLANTIIRNGFVPVGYNVSTLDIAGTPSPHITLFPNPVVSDDIFVTSDIQATNAQLTLFSGNGQMLCTFVTDLLANVPTRLNRCGRVENTLFFLLIQTDSWSEYKPIVFKNE
jgi:Cohesin domain